MKNEFVFQIEKQKGMLVATYREPEMATQGKNRKELRVMIDDLVRCRFGEQDEHLHWPIKIIDKRSE